MLGGKPWDEWIAQRCARVAAEMRIFPLLALGARPLPHVHLIVEDFHHRGFTVSIEDVAYELQRGGNQMMRLRRAEAGS